MAGGTNCTQLHLATASKCDVKPVEQSVVFRSPYKRSHEARPRVNQLSPSKTNTWRRRLSSPNIDIIRCGWLLAASRAWFPAPQLFLHQTVAAEPTPRSARHADAVSGCYLSRYFSLMSCWNYICAPFEKQNYLYHQASQLSLKGKPGLFRRVARNRLKLVD